MTHLGGQFTWIGAKLSTWPFQPGLRVADPVPVPDSVRVPDFHSALPLKSETGGFTCMILERDFTCMDIGKRTSVHYSTLQYNALLSLRLYRNKLSNDLP